MAKTKRCCFPSCDSKAWGSDKPSGLDKYFANDGRVAVVVVSWNFCVAAIVVAGDRGNSVLLLK